jgi:uncharacterized membrane protein
MRLIPIHEWRSTISRRVSEREIRRQIMYNHLRKTAAGHDGLANYVRNHVPHIFREFIGMLMGSLFAFWIIGKVLSYALYANPLYTYALFGLFYSAQSAYYKHRLSKDPDYRIPKCRCNGRQNENTAKVLNSRESVILRIPSSVFAALYYFTLLIIRYFGYLDTVTPVAIVALCASAYLSYVMVVKIGSLCANCINISALNILILFQVLF